MTRSVPDYGEFITAALELAGRHESSVDLAEMERRARLGVEAVLKQLCSKFAEISWTDVQIVLNRSDFTSGMLTDYLSTRGAKGVAVNNRLIEFIIDGIPESLATQIRKGAFDLDRSDPVHQLRVLAGVGSSPAAGGDEATDILLDPGLPEHDLTQLGYEAFKACGLTLLSYGHLSLEQHTQLLMNRVPALRDSEVKPMGGAFLVGRDDLWIGFEGPRGSVIAYFVLGVSDGDFIHENILKPMSALPPPVQWGLGTLGASVPAGVAQILADARAVPLWEISAFATQRPADELKVPPQLAAGLQQRGWDRLNDHGFKIDIPLISGRTLAAFFAPHDSESFALMVPIDRSESVPAEFRRRSFGSYELGAVDDMTVLRQKYPANEEIPSADTLLANAQTLASYTDRMFANPSRPPDPPKQAQHHVDAAPTAPNSPVSTPQSIMQPPPPPTPGPHRRVGRRGLLIGGAVAAVAAVAIVGMLAFGGSHTVAQQGEMPRTSAPPVSSPASDPGSDIPFSTWLAFGGVDAQFGKAGRSVRLNTHNTVSTWDTKWSGLIAKKEAGCSLNVTGRVKDTNHQLGDPGGFSIGLGDLSPTQTELAGIAVQFDYAFEGYRTVNYPSDNVTPVTTSRLDNDWHDFDLRIESDGSTSLVVDGTEAATSHGEPACGSVFIRVWGGAAEFADFQFGQR